jgi:hypothetical protein
MDGRGETIFMQGDACQHVMYIQSGGVRLSVLSKTGREAVVAMLGPGEFFGEGCLAGEPQRMGSATTLTPSVILLVDKKGEWFTCCTSSMRCPTGLSHTCCRATSGSKKTCSIRGMYETPH